MGYSYEMLSSVDLFQEVEQSFGIRRKSIMIRSKPIHSHFLARRVAQLLAPDRTLSLTPTGSIEICKTVIKSSQLQHPRT